MRYELKKPIVMEGKDGFGNKAFTTIDVLVFREEVVSGDLRGIKVQGLSDPSVDDLLKIAGRLCGQPDLVMNRLGIADFAQVLEITGGFLQAGQQTGTEPSPS